MNFWFIFFKTLNRWLTYLFMVSIVIVFAMDLWLLDIPAPFKLFIALGKFNYGVAISYIAAYIFYLITVHYENTQNAISVYTAANNPVKSIIGNILGIFVDMGKQVGISITKSALTEDIIKDILGKTYCYADSPLAKFSLSIGVSTEYNNWIEYLKIKNKYIKTAYNNLYPLYSKLDGAYVEGLYAVEQHNNLNSLMEMISMAIELEIAKPSSIGFKDCDPTFFLQLYHKVRILENIHNNRNERYGIKEDE